MNASDPNEQESARSGAGWVWWGLLAAVLLVFAVSVASLLMRNQRIPDRRGPPADATRTGPATGQPE